MSRNALIQLVLALWLGWLIPASAQDFLSLHGTNSAAYVTMVHDEGLLNAFLPDERRVEDAFNLGLIICTRGTNVAAAWRSLVATNETVGIKVFSEPGKLSGTRPAVVKAAIRGLLAAGVPAQQIVIWDRRTEDLRAAGFFRLGAELGVSVAGALESGFDTYTIYLPDSPVIGSLVWGDVEFGLTNRDVGKKSFFTRLVSQRLTKIISIAPLMNENAAGTCGHFYSLTLGSVDNTRRFVNDPERLAVAMPEIYALPALSDKTALFITDALLAQYQGGPASYLQYSRVRNEIWFSRDPVALDTLALKELARERRTLNIPALPSNFEIYTNAALLQLGINDPTRILIEKVRPDFEQPKHP